MPNTAQKTRVTAKAKSNNKNDYHHHRQPHSCRPHPHPHQSTWSVNLISQPARLSHVFHTLSRPTMCSITLRWRGVSVVESPTAMLWRISGAYFKDGGFFPYASATSRSRAAQFPQHRPTYWTPSALASTANDRTSSLEHSEEETFRGYASSPET